MNETMKPPTDMSLDSIATHRNDENAQAQYQLAHTKTFIKSMQEILDYKIGKLGQCAELSPTAAGRLT